MQGLSGELLSMLAPSGERPPYAAWLDEYLRRLQSSSSNEAASELAFARGLYPRCTGASWPSPARVAGGPSRAGLRRLIEENLHPLAETQLLLRELIASFAQVRQDYTLATVGAEYDLFAGGLLFELAKVGVRRLTALVAHEDESELDRSVGAAERSARYAGLELRVESFSRSVERLDDGFFPALSRGPGPRVVVLPFSLSRARQSPVAAARGELFRRCAAANVSGVVMAEHDVDHLEPNALQRLHNTWAFHSAMFDLLDRSGVGAEQRRQIKLGLFAPVLEDVLGREHGRRERQEPSWRWVQRLSAAGYHPLPWLADFATPSFYPANPYFLGCANRGIPLISVLAGRLNG